MVEPEPKVLKSYPPGNWGMEMDMALPRPTPQAEFILLSNAHLNGHTPENLDLLQLDDLSNPSLLFERNGNNQVGIDATGIVPDHLNFDRPITITTRINREHYSAINQSGDPRSQFTVFAPGFASRGEANDLPTAEINHGKDIASQYEALTHATGPLYPRLERAQTNFRTVFSNGKPQSS